MNLCPTAPHSDEQDLELQQNQAYIKTPGIPVEANECYGTTAAAVSSDELYATITEEGVQNTSPQHMDSDKHDYAYIVP